MWARNFAALERWYPPLARALSAKIDSLKLEGGVLRIEGALVHSERDPAREARRLAEGTLARAEGGGAVVLLGFGLGYAAEAVLEREPDAALIIVEKRLEVFKTALETRDMRPLIEGGRHSFVLGGHAEGILAALEAARTVRAVLRNRALTALDCEWFGAVERCLETWRTKDAVNAATLAKFGRRWVRNSAQNLTALRDFPGITHLTGKFDVPVLLIAAGPSLDEIRPHIREMRERCVIVAVDTALRFLRGAGAEPDFLVSADPQYWNLRHLDPLAAGASTGATEICLVAEPAVQNAALRLCPRTMLSSPLYPLGRFFEDAVGAKGALGAGGSVATSAFDLARLLRAREALPVFAAGLDLANPGLVTHYKGAFFEERLFCDGSRRLPAETVIFNALHGAAALWAASRDGCRVLSDKRLTLYARWFENRLRGFPATPVYALGERGLAISGLRTASVRDVLAAPSCRAAIDDGKKSLFAALDAAWKAAAALRAERFSQALGLLTRELEAVHTAALHAYQAAEEAAAAPTGNAARLHAVLDEARRRIRQSPAYAVVSFLVPPAERDGESADFYRQIAESAAFHLDALHSPAAL